MTSPADQTTSSHAARIGFWLGPIWLLATFFLPAPAGMPVQAWHCAGLALWMVTWWATEAIPIPATSLLPIVLVPALGLGKIGATTSSYADPIIFLFLGGFLLGIAMQRWNLHRRIALNVLLLVGQRPERQIAGFMLATGFISMWVSNTATTVMMLPIGMSVIGLLGSENDRSEVDRYAAALLLAIAYSASIGGIATLIGTPPNALLAAYLQNNSGITLGFGKWMIIGLPISLLMLFAAWWWLTRNGFRIKGHEGGKQALTNELAALGPISPAERRVAIVFVLTAAAWIFSPLLKDAGIPWISDTLIAIAAGIILFILPSADRAQSQLLVWEDAKGLPWGVLLLFGGGLALAAVIGSSGLAGWIAKQMGTFSALPVLLLVGVIVLVMIFLTEITSNTAITAAFLPLLGALALSADVSPLLTTVPAAIAASCAFMMPVATPPNAIVFATGQLKIQTMIRAGLFLNIVGTVLITLVVTGLLKAFWL